MSVTPRAAARGRFHHRVLPGRQQAPAAFRQPVPRTGRGVKARRVDLPASFA